MCYLLSKLDVESAFNSKLKFGSDLFNQLWSYRNIMQLEISSRKESG